MFKELKLGKGIKDGKSAVEFIKKVAVPIIEKEVNNAEIKLLEMCNKACDKSFQIDFETHFKNADNSDLIEIMDTSLEFGQNIIQSAGSILDIHKYPIPTVPLTILHDRDNRQLLVNMVKDPTISSKTYQLTDMIKYFTLSQSHIFDNDFSNSSMKTFQYLTNLQQLDEMIMDAKSYHVLEYFPAMTNNNTIHILSGSKTKIIGKTWKSVKETIYPKIQQITAKHEKRKQHLYRKSELRTCQKRVFPTAVKMMWLKQRSLKRPFHNSSLSDQMKDEIKHKYAKILQGDCESGEVFGRRNKVIPESQRSITNEIKPKYAKILHGDCENSEVSGRINKVIPESQRSITNEIKSKYAKILHGDCEKGEVFGRRNKVIPESQRSITNEIKPKYAKILHGDCENSGVSGGRNKVIPETQRSITNEIKPKYAKILHRDCKSGEVSGRRNKVIPESQRSIANEIKPRYAKILHRDCENSEVSGRRNKVIPQQQRSIATDPRGGIYHLNCLIFQSDLTSQDGHGIIPRTFDDSVSTLSQDNLEQNRGFINRRNEKDRRNLMNKKRHPELVPKMKRQQLSGNQVRNEKDDSTEQQTYDISAKETIGMTPKPKQTFRTNPEIRNAGCNSADTKPIEDPSDSQVNHRKEETYYTDDSRMDTKYKCLYKLPAYPF